MELVATLEEKRDVFDTSTNQIVNDIGDFDSNIRYFTETFMKALLRYLASPYRLNQKSNRKKN